MDVILAPPIAFLLYLTLVAILAGIGRVLAGPERPTLLKRSVYSSGEAPAGQPAAPGYRPFFIVALFFAVLHLGVLVLGSGGVSIVGLIYLIGLILALVALILG